MRTRFPTSNGGSSRICPKCGRKVARSYEGENCPSCDDEALYRKVKEYIRTHDVTELEVADAFGISLTQVRNWINEGYLTYRDSSNDAI